MAFSIFPSLLKLRSSISFNASRTFSLNSSAICLTSSLFLSKPCFSFGLVSFLSNDHNASAASNSFISYCPCSFFSAAESKEFMYLLNLKASVVCLSSGFKSCFILSWSSLVNASSTIVFDCCLFNEPAWLAAMLLYLNALDITSKTDLGE